MTETIRMRYIIVAVMALVSQLLLVPAYSQGDTVDAGIRRYQHFVAIGDHPAAIAELQRLQIAIEARDGASSQNNATVFHDLATQYYALRKFAQAEEMDRRALTIAEQVFGRDHHDVGAVLTQLAASIYQQGRYSQADDLLRRALAIFEKSDVAGTGFPDDIPKTLNQLAVVYEDQDRYGEAEALHKRSIALMQGALGAKVNVDADFAGELLNLGNLYKGEGRYPEAEGLYQRAVEIFQRRRDPVNLSHALANLANDYREQGRYAEAEAGYKRALKVMHTAYGASDPVFAVVSSFLATSYTAQHRLDEAQALLERSVAILQRSEATSSVELEGFRLLLANVYRDQGRYEQAEALYRQAIAVKTAALGSSHRDVARALYNAALMYVAAGDHVQALAYARKATAAIIAHAAFEATGRRDAQTGADEMQQRAAYFRLHLAELALAVREGREAKGPLGDEAIEMAQWASQSSTAAALQQTSARFAAGNDALSALVREHQDLLASWNQRNEALIAALAKPQSQQDATELETRRAFAETETRLAANTARLEKEFPQYAALVNPRPLSAVEVRQLLGPDEALVSFLTDVDQTYVFALTRDGFEWQTIPLGSDALLAKIAAFRRGLNLDELGRQIEVMKSTGKPPELFDLALSNQLYATLLGPVEGLIKDKKQLLVVPSGALTALPFHLLLTEKSSDARPSPQDFGPYRRAAWLIKRQAVTVLPALASLKALRAFAKTDAAGKPMVGFGNPLFDPNVLVSVGPASTPARSLATRSYADFFTGVGVDRNKLAHALPPLPDTADELRAVAKDLGAPASDIHLGKDASETTVKRLPLSDYRVVYFATHGLVAGDIKGLAEPSLALSIPAEPSNLDDGLLTASEVAQLKLNADWVILSACNTASGDKPGAEALSGLARAFFYAGARALLVSHWAVDSQAATRLTTSTFDILSADTKLGRAEALRRAMLAYLNDASNARNAYPAYWAPFEIVGEGTAR